MVSSLHPDYAHPTMYSYLNGAYAVLLPVYFSRLSINIQTPFSITLRFERGLALHNNIAVVLEHNVIPIGADRTISIFRLHSGTVSHSCDICSVAIKQECVWRWHGAGRPLQNWRYPYYSREGDNKEKFRGHDNPRKWCSECVSVEVRSIIGDDDEGIKRRVSALQELWKKIDVKTQINENDHFHCNGNIVSLSDNSDSESDSIKSCPTPTQVRAVRGHREEFIRSQAEEFSRLQVEAEQHRANRLRAIEGLKEEEAARDDNNRIEHQAKRQRREARKKASADEAVEQANREVQRKACDAEAQRQRQTESRRQEAEDKASAGAIGLGNRRRQSEADVQAVLDKEAQQRQIEITQQEAESAEDEIAKYIVLFTELYTKFSPDKLTKVRNVVDKYKDDLKGAYKAATRKYDPFLLND